MGRSEATRHMKEALRRSGVDVRGLRTKIQEWKGLKWLTLIAWTDGARNVRWALSWSFVSFDPTNWSHAICLESDKLRKSRFGRAA